METITGEEYRKLAGKKKLKYGNVKTGKYHSKKEALRAFELNQLQKQGEVRELKEQVKFRLDVNDILIATYIADFVYERFFEDEGWIKIVEDVKSEITATETSYVMKKKLMVALYHIEILET